MNSLILFWGFFLFYPMYRTQTNGRKQIRHPNHDYSSSCVYFVTICVDWYQECLGTIQQGATQLNDYGTIVKQQWLWLVEQYPHVSLDEFIVMPNHFHGIVIVDNPNAACDTSAGAGLAPPLRIKCNAGQKRIAPLTEIISAFKSTASKFIHQAGFRNFTWQRSFHDRIIRNLIELDLTRDYINNNPAKWNNESVDTRNETDFKIETHT